MSSTIDPVKNFARSVVSGYYSSSDTTIVLQVGGGSKFPLPSTDGYFNATWWNYTDYVMPADDPNVEIVRVTARSSNTLTITRAQEGTVASSKNIAGKTYMLALNTTAKMITDIEANIDDLYIPKVGQYLINGNFDVWQRGTSFTTNAIYTADRWKCGFTSGTSVMTRDTDVPDTLSRYSHKIVQTSLPAAGYVERKHRIEAADSKRLSDKVVTFSFWHKESVTAGTTTPTLTVNYASAVDNFATVGAAFASPSTVTTSAGWTKHTYTVTLPATSATGGYSIGNGIEILIRHTQTVATGTLTSFIAQVQMCDGPIAIPFQPKSYKEEERDCMRYYVRITCRNYSTNTYLGGMFNYPVPMRVSPTVSYTDLAGNVNKVSNGATNNVAFTGGQIVSNGPTQMIVDALIAAAVANWWAVIATLDAEL